MLRRFLVDAFVFVVVLESPLRELLVLVVFVMTLV